MASPLMFSFKTPGILALASVRENGDMKGSSGIDGTRNRERFMRKFVEFQLHKAKLAMARVEHGSKIRILNGNLQERYQIMNDVDALITDRAGLFIGVTYADCPSVFLVGQASEETRHKVKPVISIVHSGYKGTALNIVPKTINVMREQKGVEEKTLEAVIGPSICGNHYEFKKEKAFELFSDYPDQIKVAEASDKCLLDIPGIIRLQLIKAGVSPERITISPFCTWSDNSFLFSARREKMNPDDPINPVKACIALIGIAD